MKYLTVEEEGTVDLNSLDIACEGLFDVFKDKEDNPNIFNTSKAYDKVKAYSKNPKAFTINTKPVKNKLCLAINGKAPTTVSEIVTALTKTVKQVTAVATRLEADRIRQALILGATINTYNINVGDTRGSSGKVPKQVIYMLMRRVINDAQRASDTYYNFIGASVQKDAQSWLGGNPFNLKLNPETGRYKNHGGGKIKSVGPAPIADQQGIDKLVDVFLGVANPKFNSFNSAALDDRNFKHQVNYSIDPEFKGIGTLTKVQKEAMAIVFSGKSNSQKLQYELCEAMRRVYTSLLVYLNAVILPLK